MDNPPSSVLVVLSQVFLPLWKCPTHHTGAELLPLNNHNPQSIRFLLLSRVQKCVSKILPSPLFSLFRSKRIFFKSIPLKYDCKSLTSNPAIQSLSLAPPCTDTELRSCIRSERAPGISRHLARGARGALPWSVGSSTCELQAFAALCSASPCLVISQAAGSATMLHFIFVLPESGLSARGFQQHCRQLGTSDSWGHNSEEQRVLFSCTNSDTQSEDEHKRVLWGSPGTWHFAGSLVALWSLF